MWNWRAPVRLGGMVAMAGALGGCSADVGPWLSGSALAVLTVAVAAGALGGWWLARARGRQPQQGGHQAQRALTLLAEAWPDPLAVLFRPNCDGNSAGNSAGSWQVLQASPSVRAQWASAELVDTNALQAMLPPPLVSALQSPGEAEAEGWMLRHVLQDGGALVVLWRCTAATADESATLSYTVTHDLRAPVRAVEGFTRLVKEDHGAALDPVAHGHLDRVLSATARMNQMIDAMLTLAQVSRQALERQPVDVSQLASAVIEDLRRAEPGREVRVQVEPGMQAQGDPMLLRRVLENLLGNAWKYTAKQAHAQITFGRELVDERSVFAVRDNGAGFDMQGAGRLFGLFQRLHSASEFAGTGVGLASVRRIVQRHGGQVWAEGQPGQGATFFFTLRD